MGFRHDLEQDTVSSLPLRDAICVSPETTVRQAVAIMQDKSLGCAVIVDQDDQPVGLFTEQSLLELLTAGDSIDDRTVSEFTDPNFLVVQSSEPAQRVWDAIEKDGLRFIFVADESGQLIGVTGQRGISEYLAESFPQQVLSQRLGSTPWMQQREGA